MAYHVFQFSLHYSFFSGNDDITPTTPYQIAITVVRTAALFLNPAYTGAIVSIILIPNINLPFQDVKGIVEDGSYKIGYLKSINYTIFFEVNSKIEYSTSSPFGSQKKKFKSISLFVHRERMINGRN